MAQSPPGPPGPPNLEALIRAGWREAELSWEARQQEAAECAAAGVGACIVIASQFAETDRRGAARQDALTDAALTKN